MSRLRRRLARLVAVLVLMSGLTGASLPGFAAAPAPQPSKPVQASMGCDHAAHHPAQQRHAPAGDCCLVNLCAMNLALLTAPSGLAFPVATEMPRYDRRALLQPPGIVTAPLPHPPKARA